MATPAGGKDCAFGMMSTYFSSLDPVARERYTKRLDVLGLKEEYGHIFCYFVQRPGLYTQQELMQWKSLEAYNYFQSGFVRDVKLWAINHDQCILHAYVNPSMRSPEKRHDAWVAVKECGTIITAHCKCMAG